MTAETYMGRPCRKAGHDGRRYLANRQCVQCAAELRKDQLAKRRAKNGINPFQYGPKGPRKATKAANAFKDIL